mgnify:CR=1 FL=1
MATETMKPERQLTGKHVLAMFIAFFTVVVTVNMIMFRAATSTFGGVETDSAYKVGLAYNNDLEAARKQAALGWRVDAKVDGQRVVLSVRDRDGQIVPGLDGDVLLAWPADRRLDRKGVISARDGGRYEVELDKALPPGQWDVVVHLQRNGERVFQSKNRILLN